MSEQPKCGFSISCLRGFTDMFDFSRARNDNRPPFRLGRLLSGRHFFSHVHVLLCVSVWCRQNHCFRVEYIIQCRVYLFICLSVCISCFKHGCIPSFMFVSFVLFFIRVRARRRERQRDNMVVAAKSVCVCVFVCVALRSKTIRSLLQQYSAQVFFFYPSVLLCCCPILLVYAAVHFLSVPCLPVFTSFILHKWTPFLHLTALP